MSQNAFFARPGDEVRVQAHRTTRGNIVLGTDTSGDLISVHYPSVSDALAVLDAQREALLGLRTSETPTVQGSCRIGRTIKTEVAP